MFVLGTAGHIDHGKSVLVNALTGIDPDRLREEKERGMTIDLGFAWLKLPSGREVGIVDVPGHERFVKNMLAGVGGIDLAMLIIAANEGIMPQTREHLAILDILNVTRGIAVITKKDLVDEDLLALVRMETEELLGSTTLAGAPVIPVSALTGEGIEELKATIDRILDTTEPKKDLGHPRLAIDRVFTIAGSGTVITGTLIDGSLSTGQEVEIVPSGLRSRLRGLQTHKTRIDTAGPGSRVAANLTGVTTAQLKRGDVLTTHGWLKPTAMVTAKLRLLDYLLHPLKHNTTVSFHSGSGETMARVRLLEAEALKPGESGWVQLSLKETTAIVPGDRFIIRSPMTTLGGGKIIDAHPRRLRRFRPDTIRNLEAREKGTAEDAVMAILETQKALELASLLAETNLPPDDVRAALDTLAEQGKLVMLTEGKRSLLLTGNYWRQTREKITAMLQDYHRKFPLRPGMARVELTSRLKMGDFAAVMLRRLSAEGAVTEEGTAVHLPEHHIELTPAQQEKIDAFLSALQANPYSPPAETIPEPELLNLLVMQQKVIKISEQIVFSAAAYEEMVGKITGHIRTRGKVSLAEVRDMFQTSRKYAQALLEYLDGKRITRRTGDERILY